MPSANQLLIESTVAAIEPVAQSLREKAFEYHNRLTKPPGSMGLLESIGVDLSAIQQRLPPYIANTRVMVFAADHGVTLAHSVGPYPRGVTAQMVLNFVNRGAAINAIASATGADLCIIDIGVDADLSALESEQLYAFPVARGTADIASGPAMSREQLYQALAVGIRMADECAGAGCHAVALGEMGIGNTTIASVLTATFLDMPAAEVTGRGTGADDETMRRKLAIIEQAQSVNAVDRSDCFEVLQKLGGFELAGLAGLSLGLAKHRIAIVSDGFISTTAVYAATRISPGVADYLFCGHLSPEPGHRYLLEALQKEPLHKLGLRLGEGTGACLSLPLLKAAARLMSEMATFDEAGRRGPVSVMRRLLTAVAFLTRIPINPTTPFDGADVAKSTVFFPLVGCLIAALQISVLLALNWLTVPPVLQALAASCVVVLVGGGLHQDGLADMADGFGGAYAREDTLRIMRDSTIGTYGALALILSMGTRIASLVVLATAHDAWVWIVVAAVLSRCSIWLGWLMPYARDKGTGASISRFTGAQEVMGATVFAIVVSGLLVGAAVITGVLLCILVFSVMAWLCHRKINGVTGDTLGATTEVSEVLLLALGASVMGVAA